LELDSAEEISQEIQNLLDTYRGQDELETYHSLRKEHTHLFVGERESPVTPYVGVWAAQQRGQNGLLFVGKESLEIERFMSRCGVTKNLAAGQVNDPMDHVGTICEFMKYLCLANARAIQIPEHVVIEEEDFEVFAQKYFSPYALWCSDQIARLARCSFYAAAAILLRSLCGLFVAKLDS
ncbi:MAG: molecular chaperone TorD family protein, partial [Raoultibacter sp.]